MYFQAISRLTVHRRNGFSPFHCRMLIVALLVSNLVWLQSKPRTGKVHATLCCTCAMDTAWSFSFMCCYRQCLGRCHGEIPEPLWTNWAAWTCQLVTGYSDDIHPWWLFIFSGVSWSCQNQKVLHTDSESQGDAHKQLWKMCLEGQAFETDYKGSHLKLSLTCHTGWFWLQ